MRVDASMQAAVIGYIDRAVAEGGFPVTWLQVIADSEVSWLVALVEQHQGDLMRVAFLVHAMERGLVAGEAQWQHQAAL